MYCAKRYCYDCSEPRNYYTTDLLAILHMAKADYDQGLTLSGKVRWTLSWIKNSMPTPHQIYRN